MLLPSLCRRWSRQTHRRTFFASSTDHTALLRNAEIHKLLAAGDQTMYVLVAAGMETELVKKVPQLHLARLYRHNDTIFGAKVVNSTLGCCRDVCGRLVDAARQDWPVSAGKARSNLWGLVDWVKRGLEADQKEPVFDALDDNVISSIRGGFLGTHSDDPARLAWEGLIREFLDRQLGEEAALYQSKGFELSEILHNADHSDYASASGGSMALFSLAQDTTS